MRLFASICLIAVSLTAPSALADAPAGAFALYRPYNVLLQKTCPTSASITSVPPTSTTGWGWIFPQS
jgi:hypothetical protein